QNKATEDLSNVQKKAEKDLADKNRVITEQYKFLMIYYMVYESRNFMMIKGLYICFEFMKSIYGVAY
ncbi:MAG: hypothetical protein Q8834_02615, partial [Candidatus Phytoplasma australasiaticum]|nr:hypothetical protein [Candidatus Phytoplasma australasiaticum]